MGGTRGQNSLLRAGGNVAQEVTVNLQGSDQLAFEAEKLSYITHDSDTRIFDAYLR